MEDSNLEKDINVTPEEQEQVNNTIEVTEESKKKTLKLAKIAGYIGLFLVLAPFFITGFGFNWFWYLVIIVVAICALAMFGTDGTKMSDYSEVKNTLIGFIVVGFIMYLWGPLNSDYGDSSSGSENYAEESFGDVRSTNFAEMKKIIKESGRITEDEAKYLVLQYILNKMNDPNSYEPVLWGDLKTTPERNGEGGGWNITHRFRGTNAYGGVVTEEHWYFIAKDGYVTCPQ